MRNILISFILLITLSVSAMSAQKSNKFRVDELVVLPHPGKLFKSGKVKLTKEQKLGIKKIKQTLVPPFQKKMREAYKLQKKLQKIIAKGGSKEEVEVLLDKIMKVKRVAIKERLNALYAIQKVLTPEQWKRVNELTYK